MSAAITYAHFLLALAVALNFWAPTAAFADQNRTGEIQRVIVVNPVQSARSLIDRGDFAAATAILDALDQASPEIKETIDPKDIAFLRGLIAYGEARYADASAIFESLLSSDPTLTRVRLELGRTYFAMRRDDPATRELELAMAGGLPNPVIDNIEQLLFLMEERKTVRTRFSLSFVPDSNINQATDGETVDLFGLPFALNDEAREQGGFGVFGSAGIELRPRISKRLRLSAAAFVQHTEFKGRAYDDTIVSVSMGPEIVLGHKYLTISATMFRRWFGGRRLSSGAGGRIALFLRPSRRFRISVEFSGQQVNNALDDGRDGPVISFVARPTFSLNALSQLSATIGINREFTKQMSQRNTGIRLGAGYYREFPWGLAANFRPEVIWRPFDSVQTAFNKRRVDLTTEISIDIIKRDMRVVGLTPVVGYIFQKNWSNIGLFEFTRHRVRIGLTKRF